MCRTKLKLTCNMLTEENETLTEENKTLQRENETLRYILVNRNLLIAHLPRELDRALAFNNYTYRMARLIYIATAIRTLKEINYKGKGD